MTKGKSKAKEAAEEEAKKGADEFVKEMDNEIAKEIAQTQKEKEHYKELPFEDEVSPDIPIREPGDSGDAPAFTFIEGVIIYKGDKTLTYSEGIPVEQFELGPHQIKFTRMMDLKWLVNEDNHEIIMKLKKLLIDWFKTISVFGTTAADLLSAVNTLTAKIPDVAFDLAKSIPTKVIETFFGWGDLVVPFKYNHMQFHLIDSANNRLKETWFRGRWNLFKAMLTFVGMRKFAPVIYRVIYEQTQGTITQDNIRKTLNSIIKAINESARKSQDLEEVTIEKYLKWALGLLTIHSYVSERITPDLLIGDVALSATHDSDQVVVDQLLAVDQWRMRTAGIYRPDKGTISIKGLPYYTVSGDTNITICTIHRRPSIDATHEKSIAYNACEALELVGLTTKGGTVDYMLPHETAVFSRIVGLQFQAVDEEKILDMIIDHPNILGWERPKPNIHYSRWILKYSETDGKYSLVDDDFANYNIFTGWNSILKGNIYQTKVKETLDVIEDETISPFSDIGDI